MAVHPIEAFVFDVFGTVVDWRSGVAREAAPFLSKHLPGVDAAGFADAWRQRYQPAMEQVRSGARPFVRLDVLHRENLEAVLRDHGILESRKEANKVFYRVTDGRIVKMIALTREIFCSN